jgi:hypothetical protein
MDLTIRTITATLARTDEKCVDFFVVFDVNLMYVGPCIVVIVNEMKNQLDAT